MDREAGPSAVEENVRYRISEETFQVERAEDGRAPEFASTKAYVRPRRRRQNIRLRRSRFTFAYCLLTIVLFSFVYLLVKYIVIQASDERSTSELVSGGLQPNKTKEKTCSIAKQTYDERKDIHSHTSFAHDDYCYYILQVDAETFTSCIAEGFVLSHFIQRGNNTRKYIFDKVKQLGHDNKDIHIGAYIECRYCNAEWLDYVCRGCIINEMVLKWTQRVVNVTRQYKCPKFNPTPWDASSHGLQFLPPCVRIRAKRDDPSSDEDNIVDRLDGDDYNYGVYLGSSQFKYIKEATKSSPDAWYLCEIKL